MSQQQQKQQPWDYIAKIVCIGDSGCGKSSLTIRLCEGRFSAQHDVTIGVEFGSCIVPVGPPAAPPPPELAYPSASSSLSPSSSSPHTPWSTDPSSSAAHSPPSSSSSRPGHDASSTLAAGRASAERQRQQQQQQKQQRQKQQQQQQQQKHMKLSLWDTAGQETYKSVTRSYFRGASGALLVFDLTRRASFAHATDWLHDLRQIAEPEVVVVLVGNKSDLVQDDPDGDDDDGDGDGKTEGGGAGSAEGDPRSRHEATAAAAAGGGGGEGGMGEGPGQDAQAHTQPDVTNGPDKASQAAPDSAALKAAEEASDDAGSHYHQQQQLQQHQQQQQPRQPLAPRRPRRRQVSRAEAEAWCRANGVLRYVETSAKSGANVEAAFCEVANCIYGNIVAGKYDLHDRRSGVKGAPPRAAASAAAAMGRGTSPVRTVSLNMSSGRGGGGGGGGGKRPAFGGGGCC